MLPFVSVRQHLSCGDCMEDKKKIISTVLCCIVQHNRTQSSAH